MKRLYTDKNAPRCRVCRNPMVAAIGKPVHPTCGLPAHERKRT